MKRHSFVFAACLIFQMSLHADVKMPAIFGDHMVLQQDGKIPVWGTAEAGEKMKVSIGADSAETTAAADGKWSVDLAALPTNATGQTLTVTGKNTLTFQDVLVGDVWLAGGQSNMELKLDQLKGTKNVIDIEKAIADATHPQIRIFVVDKQTGIAPKTDVVGTWKVCSPEAAGESSAVAYFFGQMLQEKLHRPIGLIDSYWGGTAIESWTSIEALKALSFTQGGVENTQKRKDAFLALDAAGQAKAVADFKADLKNWHDNVDAPFQPVIHKWEAERDAARKAGLPDPPQPHEASNHPNSPDGEAFEYTTLFNGMINPLIPYAIKGALWYQGESNAGGWGENYDILLKTMIDDWRTRWSQGDFPFLVVGLANCDYRYPFPVDSGWAGVRGGQAKVTDTLPKTALAEAIDMGEAHNIHPVDKYDLARRLTAAALHVAYGQDVPYAGPRFDGMTIEGNKARIKFKDVGAGLTIGQSPHIIDDNPALSTTDLVGFAIAGADKKWVFGKAVMDGNSVVVSSDEVPNPVAVRFAWASNPALNLYNKDGFPAVPFRTDDWPFVAPPPVPPGK